MRSAGESSWLIKWVNSCELISLHGLYTIRIVDHDVENLTFMAKVSSNPPGNGSNVISAEGSVFFMNSARPPPGLSSLSFRYMVYPVSVNLFLVLNHVSQIPMIVGPSERTVALKSWVFCRRDLEFQRSIFRLG